MRQGRSTYPKTVYFYADGSIHGEGLRVVIQPNRFRSMEILQEFLTTKFPDLPYGVRSIFSPRGKTRIDTLSELNNNGHYIASDKRHQARGIRLEERSVLLPGWKAGRVPSAQKLLNYSLKPSASGVASSPQPAKKQMERVIYVHQNGDAFHRHRVLINGRIGTSLQSLLHELSFILCEPIYKIYTLDGKEVESLGEVFDGPEEYVAVGLEKFRPLSKTQMDLSSKIHRPSGRECVHRASEALRHRSANARPARSTNTSTTRPMKQSIPRSQEPRRTHPSTGRGEQNGLRFSSSMFQISTERSKPKTSGDNHWLIRMTMGRRDSYTRAEYVSPCTANVFLTVQGTKASSSAIPLSKCHSLTASGSVCGSDASSETSLLNTGEKILFVPGHTNEFEVDLGDIGEIVKIRLSHDNTGKHPDLLVSHIRMIRLSGLRESTECGGVRSGATTSASSHSLAGMNFSDLTFYLNAWLSQTLGDGQVTREVASRASLALVLQTQRRHRLTAPKRSQRVATGSVVLEEAKYPDEELIPLPTIQYRIKVKTSELWDSGTLARVMILLVGKIGDSGPRPLWNKEHAEIQPFQRDQVDEFRVQCVTLGGVISLKVWLESPTKKTSEALCLDWIQVLEEEVSTANTLPSSTSTLVHQPPVLFPVGMWLCLEPVPNTLDLLPLTQLVDCIYGPEGNWDFGFPAKISKLWKSMAWMFKNGMEISFYALATGQPLTLMTCGRIRGIKLENDSINDKLFTIRATDYVVAARHHRAYIKPTSKKSPKTPNGASEETKVILPVFQFTLAFKPWLRLTVEEDGSLAVREMTMESDESEGFIIRPQLNGFIQMESVRLREHSDHISRIRVDPSDGFVSTGECTEPRESLLMPFVKGSLRDLSIILLCTNSEQALFPCPAEQSSGTLIALATGAQSDEAHWCVHRVDRQVRAFESVAYRGHFLQIGDRGNVDVMGTGEVGCYFRVVRERCRGYIRLENFTNPRLCLHINKNGVVSVSDHPDSKCNRFYPVVVEFGQKPSSMDRNAPQALTTSPSISSHADPSSESSAKSTATNDSSRSGEQLSNFNADRDTTEGSLQRSNTISIKLNKDADWKIQLHTSESAYNALIVLVVYGICGNSGPIILGTSDCERCLFRAGNIDDFKVSLAGIGAIFKIRFEVNPVYGPELPYWGLVMAIFENMVTHEQIIFNFTNRPFIRMYNHCQLSREQVRSEEPIRDFLPVEVLSPDGLDPSVGPVIYRLKFYTETISEDMRQIFRGPKVTLFGRYGDSGRRLVILTAPDTEQPDGNVETLEGLLEAVYLGSITHCNIDPIAEPELGALLCAGIDVIDPLTGDIYRFAHNVWIGSTEGGQLKEATLKPDQSTTTPSRDQALEEENIERSQLP